MNFRVLSDLKARGKYIYLVDEGMEYSVKKN